MVTIYPTLLPCRGLSRHKVETVKALRESGEVTEAARYYIRAILEQGYEYGGWCKLCEQFIVLRADEVNLGTMEVVKGSMASG